MGKVKKTIAIGLSALLLVGTSANADMKSFIHQTLNGTMTQQEAGYFKSQAGGYLSAGSARIRYGTGGGTITPFNVQAPKINIGCSGIDINLGGLSFIKLQELANKFQVILQQAAGFAMQLALGALCKECQTILNEIEHIADAINGISMDTCTMARNGVGKLGQALGLDVSGLGNANRQDDQFNTTQRSWAGNAATKLRDFANTLSTPMDFNAAGTAKSQGDLTLNPDWSVMDDVLAMLTKTNTDTSLITTDKAQLLTWLTSSFGDYVGAGMTGEQILAGGNLEETKFWRNYFEGSTGDENAAVYNTKIYAGKGSEPRTKDSSFKYQRTEAQSAKNVFDTHINNLYNSIINQQDLSKNDKKLIGSQSLPIISIISALANSNKNIPSEIREFMIEELAWEYLNSAISSVKASVSSTLNTSNSIMNTNPGSVIDSSPSSRAATEAMSAITTNVSSVLDKLEKAKDRYFQEMGGKNYAERKEKAKIMIMKILGQEYAAQQVQFTSYQENLK